MTNPQCSQLPVGTMLNKIQALPVLYLFDNPSVKVWGLLVARGALVWPQEYSCTIKLCTDSSLFMHSETKSKHIQDLNRDPALPTMHCWQSTNEWRLWWNKDIVVLYLSVLHMWLNFSRWNIMHWKKDLKEQNRLQSIWMGLFCWIVVLKTFAETWHNPHPHILYITWRHCIYLKMTVTDRYCTDDHEKVLNESNRSTHQQ